MDNGKAATPEEQFEKTCKSEFDEIKGMIKNIHDKIFIGNGQPPMSVQIDRLNNFKKVSLWLYGLIAISSVGLIANLIHGIVMANVK